jgi:hypothetical protein
MKKKAKIMFNKKLYLKEAIEQAINDFSEVAKLDFHENDAFLVTISSEEDAESIGLEFKNYVLGVMKNESMV